MNLGVRAFKDFRPKSIFTRNGGHHMKMILLKKSFSENQKKIFRTQMLYIARSELG
jgi:hypothetical protein